jgi:hypothetical protein
MRLRKHGAQKGVEVVHCCFLASRPTVESIWHSETSAISPHSLHNFFCMELPFPFIEELKKSDNTIQALLVDL